MSELSVPERFIAGLSTTEYHIEALIANPQARWHVTDAERDIMLGIAICRPGKAAGAHRPLIAVSQWLGRDDGSGDVVSMYGMRYYDNETLITWPADAASPERVTFTDHRRGEAVPSERNFNAALHIASLLEYAQPLQTVPPVIDRYVDAMASLADAARPFAP
jgi:hypothetical protein